MQNVLYFMVNHLSYDVQSYSFWPGGQALWFLPAEGQTDPWASQAELVGKNPPVNAGDQERQDQSLGWESPLEEGVATHSRILAWRLPWKEEPGRLQSIGSQRVRCNWSNLACQAEPCSYSKIITFFPRKLWNLKPKQRGSTGFPRHSCPDHSGWGSNSGLTTF